nr:MAG TPA: tail protein [Caudoviricetes sp.]
MSKQYPVVIFSANEETNDYSTQGEGLLTDITFGKVTGGLTDATSLQMQYPINGVNAELIEENKILLTKINEFQDNQRMRITSVKKSLNGRMYDIKAEPIFNDIRRYFVPEAGNKEVVTNPQGAWNLLKAAAVPPVPSRFTYLSDLTSEGRFFIQSANVLEALGGTDGSLLDTFGGEYIRDNNTLHAYKQFGDKNVSYLTYGKNIEGLDMEVNIENIVIGIFPYVSRNVDGTDKLITLDEKILKYDTGDTFPNGRIEPVDFSENFEDDVTPTQDQIRALATTYMNQAVNSEKSKPLINVKVDFLELSHYSEYYDFQQLVRIGLGDVVNIYYPPMNVDVESRVIKYEYDMVKGQYSKLELGKVKANFYTKLQDNIKDVEDQINNDVDFSGIYDAIDDAIQDASDKITGNQGGNVVLSPSTMPEEILIMDTADKATAKDVLRLNKSGIGFSRDGYNGTYKTAWTIAGQFNADYITAGTLKAIAIQGVSITGSTFETTATDFTMKLQAGRIDWTKKSTGDRVFSIAANYPAGSVTSQGVTLLWGDTNGFVNIGQRSTTTEGWGYWDHDRGLGLSGNSFQYKSIGTNANAVYASFTLTPNPKIIGSTTYTHMGLNAYKGSSVSSFIEMGVTVSGKTSLVQLDNSTFKITIGNFACYGTKNSAVVTENYGHRLLNAYETPEYLFATYGKATTDDNGYAEVIIDPVFLETINTDSQNYHVFLSPYAECDAWVSYLESDSFMVNTSKPNVTVSWNLVAYRKYYEDFYLETPESNDNKTGNMSYNVPDKAPTPLDYLTGGAPIMSYPLTDEERRKRSMPPE